MPIKVVTVTHTKKKELLYAFLVSYIYTEHVRFAATQQKSAKGYKNCFNALTVNC